MSDMSVVAIRARMEERKAFRARGLWWATEQWDAELEVLLAEVGRLGQEGQSHSTRVHAAYQSYLEHAQAEGLPTPRSYIAWLEQRVIDLTFNDANLAQVLGSEGDESAEDAQRRLRGGDGDEG